MRICDCERETEKKYKSLFIIKTLMTLNALIV